MERDAIAAVEIDELGRLHVRPASREFPYVYREAMEVHWDPQRRTLHSPPPSEWSYVRWFRQILAAAREQSCELHLSDDTRWSNVPPDTQAALLQSTWPDV